MKDSLSDSRPIRLTICHSPDADDRFMFWPLQERFVKSDHYEFDFSEADTQSLNQISTLERADICAISAIHYGKVANIYQPLLMGSSVGNGYGPVLVCHRENPLREIAEPELTNAYANATLLSPGEQTTAHNLMRVLGLDFGATEIIPIVPMERAFHRIEELQCAKPTQKTAAILIHEGRLTYSKYNCHKLLDLGQFWLEQTGHAIPLGINVISRKLSQKVRSEVSSLLMESCRYALSHKNDFIHLSQNPRSQYYSQLLPEDMSTYLDLYANESTLKITDTDRVAFEYLTNQAAQCGLNQTDSCFPPIVDWI